VRGAAIWLVRLVAAQGRRQISDLSFRALPRFHCELSRNPATLPGRREGQWIIACLANVPMIGPSRRHPLRSRGLCFLSDELPACPGSALVATSGYGGNFYRWLGPES
jgi:hypothetical protein